MAETGSHAVIIVDQYTEAAGSAMVETEVIAAMLHSGIHSCVIGCSGKDTSSGQESFLAAGAEPLCSGKVEPVRRI